MNQETRVFSAPKGPRSSQSDSGEPAWSEGVDFTEALRFLRRRRRLILGCIFGTVLFAGVVASLLPERYTGAATLVFARSDTRLLQTADFESETIDFSAIETELDVLRTRLFLGRVVDELKLIEDPAFNPSLAPDGPGLIARVVKWPIEQVKAAFRTRAAGIPIPEQPGVRAVGRAGGATFAEAERDRAIAILRSSMRVWRSGDSLAVSIQVTRDNPKAAAFLANAIGNIYIEWSLALKRRSADEFYEFFRTRAKRLEGRISTLEREIADFSATNELAATRADDVLRNQIDNLGNQLARATADHAGMVARIESGRRALEAAKSGEASPSKSNGAVLASPMLAKLRGDLADLTRRQAEMAAIFGPNHSEMQAGLAQIDLTRQAIAEEVDHILAELETELVVTERTIAQYRIELASLDKQLRARAVAEIQLREMESNLVFERRRYDEVVNSLSNLDRQAEVLTPSARFLSEAALPVEPSFPNMQVILVGSGIASTMLAVMLALFVEATDTGIRSSRQLRRVTPLPNLGNLPRVQKGWFEELATEASGEGRAAPLASALEEVWSTLTRSAPKARRFMVVSSLPDEGRAELAIGLAAMVASKEQTVLFIGTDDHEDYPTLLGLESAEPRLADALAGKLSIEQAIVRSEPFNRLALLFDRTGSATRIDRKALQDLLQSVPAACDVVIIDAPPLLVGHKSDVLAEAADAAIVAVRWGKSSESTLAETLDLAQQRNYPVVGTVITAVNEAAHAVRGYGGRPQYRHAAR